MAIDDAEILARYGLDTFESPTFGNSDEVVIDAGSRKHAEQQNELGIEDLHDGSITQHSRLNRQGMNAGSEENGNEGGEDYDEDEDEDDEDDEYENERFKDPLSSNGVATHNVAFSDRDPLHVLPSVTAVLERKSDPRLLGDLTYRAKFSISHKSFSPTAFMQVVHSDTSYADLVQGTRLLRESVYQGSEALKILVHNNFDRFVDARSKIDLFYEEMKSRALNESAEYGTRAFGEALQGTTQRADEIYNPIIDRRARVEKIRSTLSVIERYKFYFNLPFNLIEYTRKGKFDIAVREYKKGRQLLQVVTKGDTGTGEETMPNMDGTSSTALSNIFHHVWKEVQSSVVELRNALFKHLSQPWKPYPEQEKAIRFLLEIDPGEQDPVAYYLEHHHAWIIDQMDELYKGHKQKLTQTGHQQYLPSERRRGHSTDGAAGSATAKDPALEVERRADELTRALQIESFADFPAFTHGRDSEFHMWKQIYNALRTLSQTLVRCLPDFWKLSQAYMEDLYQKPGSNGDGVAGGGGRRRRQMLDLDKVTKCHALLEDIIEKYSRHVLRMTGVLGDTDLIINLDSLGRSQIGTTLQRLPQTHALLAGHFMTAIMELVVNTANDIEAIDMAQEPAIIFANLISQLKAGLVLFLCEMWDRDARSMSLHENWRLHHGTSYWPPFYIARRRQDKGDSPSTTAENIANTELLPLFLRTAQTLIGQLGAIHAAALQPGKSTRTLAQGQTPHFNADFDEGQRQQSERSHQLHDMAVSHTKRTFFGTMYSFLDTLHVLAFNTMPYGAGDGNGGVSAAAGARPSSSSLAQQSPLAKSMLPRRLSFNLPSKSDTGGALATNRRHSVVETERHEQSKLPARHSTRSFYILATLCNLTAFRLFVVPDLLHSKAVRYTFKLDVADELPKLEKMLRRLDEMVFNFYIHDKSKQLSSIVRRGVLMGGFSWSTTEMPKDTQPYVSEALLYLVFTHAEIMDLIAEAGAGAEHHMVKHQPLTKRVFQVLTGNLAQDLLESVRVVDSFSVGGMLQCVLEALVISRTLHEYITPDSQMCFGLLHNYVRSAYDRTQERAKKLASQQGRPMPDLPKGEVQVIDGVSLTSEHWEVISQLLRDCTRRTQIQFRCFQSSTSE